MKTSFGEVDIDIPRDCKGEFEPQLVKKQQTSLNGDIEEKILSMYAKEWQQRPLEEIYAVVFLDAIHYHVRSEGQIVKKAVYIAIGINMSGIKEVLGMWVGENESAKYWLSILNGLRNRDVEDILIACVDGLTGFDNAIEAVYPKTEIQQCIIHQIRNTTRFVPYKDIKALMADLKRVYVAVDEETALYELETFGEKWNAKYQKLLNRGKQTDRNYPPILSIRWRFGR